MIYLFFLLPPAGVEAFDTPNDEGGSITIRWKEVEGAKVYLIYRKKDTLELIGKTYDTEFSDDEVEDGVEYVYGVRAVVGTDTSDFAFSPPAAASPQLFDTSKLNIFFAVFIYLFFIVYFVRAARGRTLFIRRIAGLDALDEAVGRATEMGRPILYVPGLSGMGDVATIAAINILKPVAKKAAEYETPIIVPNCDPIVMTVAQQVVKEAYLEAGRPDAYREDNVFYLTDSQFAYAAGVDGIMMRERPATNLFMGMFYAESLILAETGNMTGAIQIAGTDAVAQLPFFIAACDYTIIGEELYAASAYLSQDPKLVGSLKAQDVSKAILMIMMLLGTVLSIFGLPVILNLFNTM